VRGVTGSNRYGVRSIRMKLPVGGRFTEQPLD
jgi:hypothetical protein